MKKTNIGRGTEKLYLKVKIYLDFFAAISVLSFRILGRNLSLPGNLKDIVEKSRIFLHIVLNFQ